MMTANNQQFGPVTVYFGCKNGKYPDGNQVVVNGRDTKIIFDTPLLSHRLIPQLSDADLIVLGHVHEDHTVGLGRLAHIPLMAPQQDLYAVQSMAGMLEHYGYSPEIHCQFEKLLTERFHFVPRPDAKAYHNGALWDLGGCTIRALHTPGHTGGHSALFIEPGGIAFIGDIDLSGFGPYYGDGCSNLRDFIETLDRLKTMQAKTWITYHHKGVITDEGQFRTLLKAYRGKIDQREAAIVAELQTRPMTLDELVAHRFLYPPDYQEIFVEDAERITITQHLQKLLDEERIAFADGRYWVR
jgi:glyoxylase-like metal-dependent hydrolase (beta-lactamase superfamily II)